MSSLSSSSSTEISSTSSSTSIGKEVKKNRPTTVKIKATKFRSTGFEEDEPSLIAVSKLPAISLDLLLADFSSSDAADVPYNEPSTFSSSTNFLEESLSTIPFVPVLPPFEVPLKVKKDKKVHFSDSIGVRLVQVKYFDRDVFEESTFAVNDVKMCTQHVNEGVPLKNPLEQIDEPESPNEVNNFSPDYQEFCSPAPVAVSRSTFVSSAHVKKEDELKSIYDSSKKAASARSMSICDIPETYLPAHAKHSYDKENSKRASFSKYSDGHDSDHSKYSVGRHRSGHSKYSYDHHHSSHSKYSDGQHSSYSKYSDGHHSSYSKYSDGHHHSGHSKYSYDLHHSSHSHDHDGSLTRKKDYHSSDYGRRNERDDYHGSSSKHHHNDHHNHDHHHRSSTRHYSISYMYDYSEKSHKHYRYNPSPSSRSPTSFRLSPYEKEYYYHRHRKGHHSRERSYSPKRNYSRSVSPYRY